MTDREKLVKRPGCRLPYGNRRRHVSPLSGTLGSTWLPPHWSAREWADWRTETWFDGRFELLVGGFGWGMRHRR